MCTKPSCNMLLVAHFEREGLMFRRANSKHTGWRRSKSEHVDKGNHSSGEAGKSNLRQALSGFTPSLTHERLAHPLCSQGAGQECLELVGAC